ncbi:MAG TPA: c-type cytochrome [Pseudonocardia sp.]|jgi:ubiquinol-cytochrome c reductase cytochrome c subunit
MTTTPPPDSPDPAPRAARRPFAGRLFARRGRAHRRVAGALALGLGLLTAGGLYTAATADVNVAHAQEADAATLRKGQELFNQNACITCHGSNLQGVVGRGPSLIGVGDAAVYFQVSSGRMPLARQEAQAERKPPLPQFDPDSEEGQANLDALGAYIQAQGGGPTRPEAQAVALRGDDPARGSELFRLNCASCHNFTGRGGALSSGKYAPTLDPATETQIYTAMLSGPQNMPKFSDRQLTPEEKEDIIAYIISVRGNQNSVGGNPLGGIGPVSEGLMAFLVGLMGMVGFAIWLGAKT